jgi:putative membrane protein
MDQRRQLGVVFLTSLCAVALYEVLEKRWVSIQVTPLTALGVALGVFLSLRNNVVYDRYWEARSLWGRLINSSRSLPRQLATFLKREENPTAAAEFYQEMGRRHIAYVAAFRSHLRNEDPLAGIEKWIDNPESLAELRAAKNVPAALLHQAGERLHDAWKQGLLTDFHLGRLDETMTDFTDIQGGCERIKNTPLPPAYTHVAHKIVLFYCCMIPFGLVADLKFLTPALTIAISFAFLTLDRISDLIENPFSRDPNDLPLDQMTRLIEIDMLQRLDETDLPPAIQPKDGILL